MVKATEYGFGEQANGSIRMCCRTSMESGCRSPIPLLGAPTMAARRRSTLIADRRNPTRPIAAKAGTIR